MNPINQALDSVCSKRGLDKKEVMKKIPELREMVEG